MNAINSIPEHQKPEFMRTLETMQMKDSLKMYNNLVADCFRDCVNGFRSKTMDPKEEACVCKCAEKYIKLTQRVGFRFAEHQAQQQQQQS
ncbi:Tim10/DDP family zinc finger protein [Pelagophyceae sp. CCMP2097]|nr:Tim10/DDP family zinc finger protein [Pelagophyceae sp. CCMP2097]|mmetsp:Transcript_14313/g.50944  ORF Transcript_14313/g.50944 Transcript_14313/m.50944 type:complete len:90 (-) Transcript_14313:113-382(-)